mmetsp:Transcript_149690/g.480631  ORF Transcript_149690/g.480631 Transcript_149690/m.480631 type:complete len:224 (-) Transcript_149690:2195-2866(-)
MHTSKYTDPASLSTTCLEKPMKANTLPSSDTIGCTRTPIAMPLKSGMPAAWRLCTARSVNMLLQTCSTAFSSAAGSLQSTPSTESWRPAPETPSRSSLLAEERTATRSVPAGKPLMRSSTTSLGTLHFSTAALAASARDSSLSDLSSKAFCKAATASSTSFPDTALVMTPNGTAKPWGAMNPAALAIDSSFPEEAALDPAVWGESAKSITGITFVSFKLSSPT